MRRRAPTRCPLWPVLVACLLFNTLALAAGSFHTELERVHGLIAKGRYAEARSALQGDLAPLATQPAQRALLLEAQGTIEAALGRVPEAIAALRRGLELEGQLSTESHRHILLLLGQLQLRTGDYEAAAETLEAWFRVAKRPTPEAHLLLGSAYLRAGRLEAAIAQLERANRLRQPPPEDWSRQLLAGYRQAGRDREAAVLLRQLLTADPDQRSDWLQLAALQLDLDAPAEALGILEMAEHRGWLTEPSELLELVRLQLALGVPYRAARLLEDALARRRLAASRDTYRLLIDAWRQAREPARALAACRQANGEDRNTHFYRIEAELALELGHWDAAIVAAEQSIATAGDQATAEAKLLLGIALASQGRLSAARSALRQAGQFTAVRAQAATWLRYVEQVLEQPPTPGA